MPQKTDLNISPYYDDFDKEKNHYRVLFKPGNPIQAREITGLQSILQNQIESFGTHFFKEGSMVIPGGITCDNAFTTIKVNRDHLGIDVTVYIDALCSANNGKGVRVKGESSGVVGTLKGFLLPPEENIEDITIFVKYVDGGDDGEAVEFDDGEILTLEENVTYGNTTLNTQDSVLTLVSVNSTNTGYAVGVSEGVYFIRGLFVDVPNSQIVLDPYNNEPSYRVGFDIFEEIVTSDDDSSLNDNAKGFTNYAAPGADRLKISVKLSKKSLLDFDDTDFVELVKVDQGKIKKLQNKSNYNLIRDYFAKRTFEESGNYSVNPFIVSVSNSLNDEIGNEGLYIEGQRTEEGNIPSDNLASVVVSSGTAYVRGFDIDLNGSTVTDVEKPRTTKKVDSALVPFKMGGLLKVNNVFGVPYINIGNSISGAQTTQSNIIELYNRRRDSDGSAAGTIGGGGTKIGQARIYWYGLADSEYVADYTEWELYLFDIQTYTTLYLSKDYSTIDVPVSSYFRGLSSGATGYFAEKAGLSAYSLIQTSGTFLVGEQVIINENDRLIIGIDALNTYTTEDIKSVYQNSSVLNTALQTDFLADTVLYERTPPNFSITDKLNITTLGAATSPGRFFSGRTGIKTESIIKYQIGGNTDPTFNRVASISANGSTVNLAALGVAIPSVCDEGLPSADTESVFSIMEPKILNIDSSGLFTELPKTNIASVDLSSSELTISREITGRNTDSAGSLTIRTSDALDASAGITSVFFETYDAERYSIHYSDGTTDTLNSGKFTFGSNGESVTFTGLRTNQTNVTAIVTLKKRGVTNKSKDFIRSRQVSITRTSGISTANNNTYSGLTTSNFYGLRVEDKEICLNVPDVVNIRAIYESTNSSAPVLDKLTFATGLSLDVNAIVGEKIVGKTSRSVAQVVNRGASTIEFVSLNENDFQIGEVVEFKESAINAIIQDITPGVYIDKTNNYLLDDGHKNQYCDYSRITRIPGNSKPSRQLLVIFDYYAVSSGNSGDLFTVNSYTAERYTQDIPILPDETATSGSEIRVSDVLDFRPRVQEFDPDTATQSPFTFASRSYESNYRYVISPNETSFLGYSYYLPRTDLVTINRFGEVEIVKGEPDEDPKAPIVSDDAMEIAQISYPAYLFDPQRDVEILLRDNRRFTMRDIAKLEDRIENLEEVTSLNMLEIESKSIEVTDTNGINRFKSGFVVTDFKDKSLADPDYTTIDISESNQTAIAPVDFWSINAELALDPNIDRSQADLTQNLKLLDPNIQKSGDILTLKYTEVDWIQQPHATNVENVNPFNVITFVGGVQLDPVSDNWVRTIYVDDHRVESTGAKWIEEVKTTTDVKVRFKRNRSAKARRKARRHPGWRGGKLVTKTTTTTEYKQKLRGPSREFDYIEDVKISGVADQFMRSRNVYFNANGLRPFTKHYHYLDSQQVDVIPKLCEIEMQSGVFEVFENAFIYHNNKKIGYIRVQRPNHKFTDTTRPDIGSGLSSPATLVEEYTVDPYDRNRPAPGDSYTATSKLINFGVRVLSTMGHKFYGYVVKDATVVGEKSGAVAKITRAELISDNWGDIVGNFFFREPTTNPPPPVKVKTGTKTVKVTALPPGTTSVPGSTVFASEALGTYSGSGTVIQHDTTRVSVRNPPKPITKPTEVQVETKAVHRDPLAQSFTVDGKGAFITSFDLYFASKDPSAKVFVELRTVDLGTPTSFLVADYAQVALNPSDININTNDPFDPIPTRIRFPSPIYLEAEKEYAIVVLSPASDKYELWTATMGKKTVKTQNLPDVQNVVVTKQYIGGSLFKSQNGTIWTPSQYQDLTFKLYKAKFVNSGTLTFYNTDITPNGTNVSKLDDNPIEGLPRKLRLPITGTLNTAIVSGTRIGEGASPSITGTIENIGGPIANTKILTPGFSYPNGTVNGVDLYSISGKGTGAQANLVFSSGSLTGITMTANGTGYVDGEVLGITTSSVGGGFGAKISVVSLGAPNVLYLTNVQGENFTNTAQIVYYTDPTNEATRTNSGVTVDGPSTLIDNLFSGNVFRIKHYNHAHHGGNNVIQITDISPDREKVAITANFGENDTVISVANTLPFSRFEGITTTRGYALIQSEVVSYSNITQISGNAGTLTIDSRALNGTVKTSHSTQESIQPYEVDGVSLMRINKTHNIPSTYYNSENSNLDNYFLEFDRSTPTNRNSGSSMLNFESQKGFGGKTVGISQNHQFSAIKPQFNVITPGKGTAISAQVRTTSGTSAGGSEVSFLDLGYEPIQLNETTLLPSPRIAASRINETTRLSSLPLNKSLTLKVDFSTADENLSPVMDIQNATFVLGRNRSNSPILDYSTDPRSNLIDGDPHGSVFVTKVITLDQPATSLRLLVAANRQPEADFRAFYRLFKADSSDIPQSYTAFPGYDNLIDTDGDGFGDLIPDVSGNNRSGRADAFVAADTFDSFSEYQFTANNLDQFNGFSIKIVMSSTNESTPVKLKDFRCIALA